MKALDMKNLKITVKKNMNYRGIIYFILIFLFIFNYAESTIAQDNIEAKADTTKNLSHKEKKAEKKQLNKEALKGQHFEITSFLTLAHMNSRISITGPNGVLGASISLEKFLGFKNNVAVPAFKLKYAFTRRSSIYAEYYNIYRSVKHDGNKEFEFGDIIVPEDIGTIKIYFNTDIWSVGYRYTLINAVKADLSFFFNIFFLRVGTGIDIDKENITKDYAFTAPLPSFGYNFSYEMAKNLYFGASMSFFILELGDFGGFINNTNLSVYYETTKWLKLGLGINYFNLQVNTSEARFKTDIEYSYFGPNIFTGFVF